MLRRDNHVCGSKECVASGSVDLELLVGRFSVLVGDSKINLGAFASANPVSLHCLYALRPVKAFQIFKQAVSISRDFKNPLTDDFMSDLGTASVAVTFFYFLVGKTCETARTPVDGSLSLVSQAFFVELEENPLSPFVVVRSAGDYLPVPVIAETQGLDLLGEMLDVLKSGCGRVCACFDGVVFGWKTEGVISHGVKDIVAPHSEEA